ncbi:hypothetical protein Hanom_Chr13g01204891 [Helianthus anomalus]
MSDQWASDSKAVLILKLDNQEVQLYQAAFSTFGGVIGSHPLRTGEQYWYDQIRGYFMYPVADAFADQPTSTEEIVYLSSEETVGSSNGELSPWSTIFAGVLRDLGIDPEEKKKKPKKKKAINLDANVTSKKGGSSRATTGIADKGTFRLRQSSLEDYVIISDSFEGLSRIGERKTGAAGSKSSWSAGSRNPDAGATPSFAAHEEGNEEEEVEEEPVVKLIRKRSREAVLGASMISKSGDAPLIGKRSNLRSLYKFSPGEVSKVTIKPFTASQSAQDKEGERRKVAEIPVKEKEVEKEKAAEKPPTGPKVSEVSTLIPVDQPLFEKGKGQEVEKPVEPSATDAPVQAAQVTYVVETGPATKEHTAAAGDASAGFAADQAGAGKQGAMPHSPIGPMDTLGDVYYNLKQKDTFLEFALCRDWLLNSIPPSEVNRQRERTHSALYHAYVVGEANTRATNHQIVREWRTMNFEKSKAAFDEEKAKFETDKKAEEWGREGLKSKLGTAKELLSKERADWKAICARDNEHMYAARTKITELEGQVTDLKKKVGDAEAVKEQAEAELKAQISGKDKDLATKDVEIAELKRRLQEQIDKSESLEIDLEAEKSRAATAEEAKQKAEEARAISSSALNVAQNNYVEAQGIVDTLASEAEWLRGRGIALIANSVLNAGELDKSVAALIDASRVVGHRGGYLECRNMLQRCLGKNSTLVTAR